MRKHNFWGYNFLTYRRQDVELDDTWHSKTYALALFVDEANEVFLQEIGDPVDDLAVATVLMVIGGQLILLRPRKVGLKFKHHE
jgi:hypothetical protein